ncbi:hypothetical protein C1Y40_03200 [Mycobacterium talmoniae]|uniref:Uncharacterized protein n=1 Tax=Mycobacterium talmoniae TaxID=1858794 RepID=A0A2S8BJ19_9MYCO|nr:hypothetical protein C1Y40_03200 [Mycobacterium talmoniae]
MCSVTGKVAFWSLSTLRQFPGPEDDELTLTVPIPSGPATTFVASPSAIHTQPGPVTSSCAVAPLVPCTSPKSMCWPGTGKPTLGRICIGESTCCGDSLVPGAICAPCGSWAGAVVITSDIRRVAAPAFTLVRSTSMGSPIAALGTEVNTSTGAPPSTASDADITASPARVAGSIGVPAPSTSPNFTPFITWPARHGESGSACSAGKMSVEM